MAENDKDCTGTVGPTFPEDGGASVNPVPGCTPLPGGGLCPPKTPTDPECNPWQLSQSPDNCFIDGVVDEALGIAGADLNVYKLLGVHEQGKLVDVTGKGQAISGGDLIGFPAANAFDMFISEWRSLQTGFEAIRASTFIGYDFGDIKVNDESRRMYGSTNGEASIRKHITAFAIKQSSDPDSRVTQARLERSENGMKWYGVQVVNLPDDDCLNTILSRSSVQSRYWRLRPLAFNGGDMDRWSVVAFQMFHDYDPTHISNIQDKILLENRDRDYNSEPIVVKGSYDLLDVQSELTRFGIELPSQQIYMQVNFTACVAALGRPLVIGDIIQLPSETQYDAELNPIEKWMEVTDTSWSTEGYTPGWRPTLMRIILQPAFVSQETQDIFGDLAENEIPDELGLVDKGDGRHPIFQDYSDASQEAEAEALDAVPQRGAETSGTIRAWEEEEVQAASDQGLGNLQKIGQNPIGFQTEDAMPPNNAPFTEGDSYPTSPTHGDYHRLTYEAINSDVPARLYRYSSSKGRWIFLEKDKRDLYNSSKPVLQEFLTSPNAVNHNNINREDDC
jgi:hypothetical protein